MSHSPGVLHPEFSVPQAVVDAAWEAAGLAGMNGPTPRGWGAAGLKGDTPAVLCTRHVDNNTRGRTVVHCSLLLKENGGGGGGQRPKKVCVPEMDLKFAAPLMNFIARCPVPGAPGTTQLQVGQPDSHNGRQGTTCCPPGAAHLTFPRGGRGGGRPLLSGGGGDRGTQERQQTRGGATQTHRTREPHQEGQSRAQQTRRRGTVRQERQPEQREQGTRMEGMGERAHGRQRQ